MPTKAIRRRWDTNACAIYYDGWYRLAYATGGYLATASVPNQRVACVSLDGNVPRWCEQTGLNVGRFVKYEGEGDNYRLFYTDSTYGYLRRAEVGHYDQVGDDATTAAIDYKWQTGYMPKGHPVRDFYLRRGWLDYRGEDNCNVAWVFDRYYGSNYGDKDITLDDDKRAYWEYPMGEEGRRVRFELTGATDADLEIYAFTTETFSRPRRPR